MDLTLQQRKHEINRITWWGVFVNILLAISKLLGGIFGHSQALIADGLHSLSDLISDAMVLFAAKHAGEDADDDHPYGHARFETIATVALGILLILVAIGIFYDAMLRLLSDETIEIPRLYTLLIAAFSILSNEVLYHFTKHVGLKISSKMLLANAWHHRSDAISSIVVLIGIAGAQMGLPLLDAAAAVIVALMIVKIGAGLGYHGIMELVDTALEPELVEKIRQKILSLDEVSELHMLRSRRMGHNALVDVHIQVAPKLSVSEGHHISESVEKTLIDSFDEINDVTVHIDPENDDEAASCKNLPMRSELILSLQQACANVPELKAIDHFTLHYLSGQISVEADLPLDCLHTLEDTKALQSKFRETCLSLECVGDAILKFH